MILLLYRHWKWTLYGMHVCLALILLSEKSVAQNLVPNPSFEDYTFCPSIGGGTYNEPMLCPPWWTWGSCDYFHECSFFWAYSVPNNVFGGQFARTGAAYIGCHSYGPDFVRELASVALIDTLEAGHCYKVGFYLNLGDTECGIDHFGALLSSAPLTSPLGMTPQIDLGGNMFTDTINWVFIFDYIVANGDEAYITIGNFYRDAETTFEPNCQQTGTLPYFFIEDVIVEEVTEEPIDVEIDGPIEACDSFLIEPTVNPDVDDILFIWNTGYRGRNLMVTTSGEYTVTAYYGCNTDVASVEVILNNPPPVQLADDDFIMCAGETYEIALDLDYGTYQWQDGSTGTDYSISATGQYSVTLDDGCDMTSDTIDVLVVDPPLPLSLGADTFLCPGDMLSISFDPAQGDYMWQDGSDNPSYQIDEEGTYSFTVTNMCGMHSDEIDVIEIIPPAFDIGPDTTRICNGDIIDIALNPTMGSYHWQDGNNSPFYTITQAGVYSITVTNNCGMETDQMVVVSIPAPLINLGPDTNLCQGDTILLDGGMNTGNYQWQNGSTNHTFDVTTSGQYALLISNACGFDRDTVNVAVVPLLTQPDLGPDINLCPGEEAVLSVNVPGASVVWNDLSTANTLLVDTAGIYFVQVANACGTLSDTILISGSGEPPSLTLAADFDMCQGDTVLLDAGISGVSYQWNDGAQTSQLNVTSPGQYALTVTNSCGADSDTIVVNDGGPAPTVSLGIDTSICSGTSLTISPGGSNVFSWLWQDGSTFPEYTATAAGEVHVTVSNSCGVDADTMQIGLLPAIPSLSLGPDTSLCPGNSLTLTIGIPGVDILWSDGTTDPAITVTDTVHLFASITNVCGVSTDTIVVSMLDEIPPLNLGPDQSLCPGELITLDPGIMGVNYLWQDGSTGSMMSVTQAETITLVITNDCGTATDTMEIYESTQGPQVDLGPDIVACAGETVVIETNISGVNYVWQDGSDDDSFTATTSGNYFVEVSNLCGSDSDTIAVDISGVAPTVDLGADTILCEGTTLLLTYQADAITTVVWQDGSDVQELPVQSAGIYSLTATNRCGNDSDSIQVGYLDAPDPFDLGADTVLCAGESILLSAPATTNEILWQDGSRLPQLLASTADTYILEVSNACGTQTDSITVGIDNLVPFVNLGADTVLCTGDFILLDATQVIPVNYLWNTGDETPRLTVMTPGIYAITVFTECKSASDEIEILEKTDCMPVVDAHTSFYIPNVFSPNDDQVNDIFSISFGSDIHLLSIDGSIFDRWGNLIFHSMQLPFIWDGKRNQSWMQPGVYVYALHVSYEANGRIKEELFTGEVTLIR